MAGSLTKQSFQLTRSARRSKGRETGNNLSRCHCAIAIFTRGTGRLAGIRPNSDDVNQFSVSPSLNDSAQKGVAMARLILVSAWWDYFNATLETPQGMGGHFGDIVPGQPTFHQLVPSTAANSSGPPLWHRAQERGFAAETRAVDKKVGHSGKDHLTGNNKNETLVGLGGDDYLYGRGGNDELRGGAGLDHLYGELGDDRLLGGRGNDQLHGGEGDDVLRGGRGRDDLSGETGNDELFGGRKGDHIYGGDGDDMLRGGRGRDDLSGGTGTDELFGGRDGDHLHGGAGQDFLLGGKDGDHA